MNMVSKYLYGNSWEKFPIKEREIWKIDNKNIVSVHDFNNPLPHFVYNIDLLFVDPPWNLGQLNSFYNKSNKINPKNNFNDFVDVLFMRIKEIKPDICYIEIGDENKELIFKKLKEMYINVQDWKIKYSSKSKGNLFRGTNLKRTDLDFSGLIEKDFVKKICKEEDFKVIGDICMGRGLVGIEAFNLGKTFVGIELNKRRLAVLLDKLNNLGGKIKKDEERN